jgi:hypothetical protein
MDELATITQYTVKGKRKRSGEEDFGLMIEKGWS